MCHFRLGYEEKCFLVVVADRSAKTLIPIIGEFIAPGTEIVSDEWKAYNCLDKHYFEHLKVNHSVTFKDYETGACTNKIEGLWTKVKRSIPSAHRDLGMCSPYLSQFMYFRRTDDNECIFDTFIEDKIKVYSPL